jgi:hypothetical protein
MLVESVSFCIFSEASAGTNSTIRSDQEIPIVEYFWLIVGALLAGFVLLVFAVAYDSRRINKGRH